jgi:hypothetical protein
MMRLAVMAKKLRSVEFLPHSTPVLLAQLVQTMLAKYHIQQVREPQNSHHTAPCEFFLFPAQRKF